ncbi:MAG TPA: hypothetical protein VND99_04710 [Candidatus Acidoferrales bacterium]|nr:hypothetical protein [Candidatus Acidoferrales bacterium]
MKYIIASIIFVLIFLAPLILDSHILRSNDINDNITPLVYTKNVIYQSHSFPQWVPYIDQGLPMIADPTYSFYNPLVALSVLSFPIDVAFKVIYTISLIFAIFTIYILCRYFVINKNISFLLGLIYASSGYFVSRITAGHSEKILSYPLLPLFLYCLFRSVQKFSILWSGLTSLVLTLIYFSGDFYNFLYGCIALGITFLYYLVLGRKKSFIVLVTILLIPFFSAIKLFPFTELPSYIYHVIEPYTGSQNPISMLYYIFLPIKLPFILTGTKQFITTDFAWWGKITFIGPLLLIGIFFFFYYFKKISNDYKHLLYILLMTFALVSMPAWNLNPYHYLLIVFSKLQLFHVPSNIFAFMSVIVIIMAGIGFQKFTQLKKTTRRIGIENYVLALLIVNLLITFVFSEYILIRKQLKIINPSYKVTLSMLKQKDPSKYYIGAFLDQSGLPQNVAVDNQQLLLEDNYGLQMKDSPAEHFTPYDFFQTKTYNDIAPKYFIIDSSVKLSEPFVFNIKKYFTYKDTTVFRVTSDTPFVYSELNKKKITNNILTTEIGLNTFTIKAKSNDNLNKIVMLESYYPGWQITIDGKSAKLFSSRFLEFNAVKGIHTYVLTFNSSRFVVGAVTTFISIGIWGFLVLLLRKRKSNYR